MRLALTSLVLLCLAVGARAQNVARQSLVLNTDGKLTSAVFSPDGKLLATSYDDKTTVRLLDAQTGELRARFSGKDDPTKYENSSLFLGRVTIAPSSSTFSRDGRLLAVTAYIANEVRLWDVQSGKLLVTLRGLSDVRNVQFSRDGRIMAIAAGDQGLKLVDIPSLSLITTRWKVGNIKSIDAVLFPPDEKSIALSVTSFDSPRYSVYLIELETGSVKARTGDRRSKNYYISYISADAREMGTVNESGEASLWDVTTGQVKWTLKLRRKGYPPVSFGPGARTLAVLNEDGTVGIWDCEKGQVRATLPEKEKVEVFDYRAEERFLVTGTKRGIKLWDAKTLEPLGEMEGARAPLVFRRDGKVAVSAGDGNKAILWEISNN